jgi:branched-chain amino acid transport system substrate-binding protein
MSRLIRCACFAVAACTLLAGAAKAQISNDTVKIGVLTDFESNYSDVGGKGSLIAARMAVDQFGGKVLGKPIEIISADHGSKPDSGCAIARRWYDEEGVDMIITGEEIVWESKRVS